VLTLVGISVEVIPSNATTPNSSVDGWAVLLEMNEFPEPWSDMPLDFINSERMQTTLLRLGWKRDHIYEVRDNLTIEVVQDAVEWLVNNTDSDDIALLHILTHGSWMRSMLLWNDWFPDEWERITSRKVLMVLSCSAEEFIEPVRNDLSPHISLACCSVNEAGWVGTEEEGLPILGSVWNYYLTNALCNSSADLDNGGFISIEEAFSFSTPLCQKYMNETVLAVPEFLEMYHDIGIYPENYDVFPHPVMDDQYPGQLCLDLQYINLLPDLNNDGTVNIVDVSIVAMAFGTQEGDENYNVLADLDKNGEINIIDVSTVAMDYGKTV
jgi:hypothetical protein